MYILDPIEKSIRLAMRQKAEGGKICQVGKGVKYLLSFLQNINKDGGIKRGKSHYSSECTRVLQLVLHGKPLFACNNIAVSSMYIVICYLNAV